MTRNGSSILESAFVADSATVGLSVDGVLLANDLDNTDGETLVADPDELNALSATFTDAHIGNMILLNGGNANDGWYRIGSRTDADNVNLVTVAGAAASLVTASAQRWDMYLALAEDDIVVVKAVVVDGGAIPGYWTCKLKVRPR